MSDGNPDRLHIVPTHDLVSHDTDGGDCICGPDYELVQTEWGDRYMIKHHSLDGRELREAEEADTQDSVLRSIGSWFFDRRFKIVSLALVAAACLLYNASLPDGDLFALMANNSDYGAAAILVAYVAGRFRGFGGG